MMRLRSLGECVIDLGGVQVGPESEVLFGLLLYLIVERGHRVPRARLIELCWPGESDERARHNLRQALYKAKQLGAVIGQDGGDALLASSEAEADYDALLDPSVEGTAPTLDLETVEFLPSYEPRLSDAFTEWLESRRAIVHSAVRRHLVARIARARRSARWSEVERLARRCLELDEMNEEAVIGLAEATAVTGSRALAASILDRYLAELGSDAKLLGRPARELRRRILEVQREGVELRGTFVGRDAELAALLERLELAVEGDTSSVLLWGPAGMGKTRLVTEFCKLARLRGVPVISVGCVRGERAQPMSFFIEFLESLLQLPGAIGASPSSVSEVQQLVSFRFGAEEHAEQQRVPSSPNRIVHASAELLQAVSDETAVVVVAEDVHWLDEHSAESLAELIHRSTGTRVLFVLSSRQQRVETLAYVGGSGPLVLQLTRLRADAATELLTSLLPGTISEDFTEWGATVSEGNPLFVREIAEHTRVHGEVRQLPPTLDAMLRARLTALSPQALRVLQVVALLDKFASFDHVEALLGVETSALIDAVDSLEQEGLIRADESGVRCDHQLIADAALGRLAPATRRLLHRRAALVLESAWQVSRATPIAWASSRHWRAAQAEERATATTHACAQQLIAIGMPLQALELLQELKQSELSSELLKRHFKLIVSAQRSAGQWAQVLRTLETLRKTRAFDEHAEPAYRLVQFDAGLRLGQPMAQILSGASELACSQHLPRALRFESAVLAASLADEVLNTDVLDKMRDVVSEAVGDDELTLRDRTLLIYHTVRGQLPQALALCDALLARAEAKGNPIELSRILRNSTIALRLAGKLTEAIRNGERAMALAMELAIPSAIFPSGDCLAGLYLVAGRTHDALRVHEYAEPHANLAEDLRSREVWLEQKARIYVAIGDAERAREIVDSMNERLINEGGRHSIEVLSLLVRMGHLRQPYRAVGDMVRFLRNETLRAAPWGSQDSCAESVVEGLSSLGDDLGAQQFALAYRALRRERYPMPDRVVAALGIAGNRGDSGYIASAAET